MQHRVGVQSLNSVQVAIKSLKDGLADMPYPGKVRQMAIDALMKTVEDSDKIDDDTRTTLGQVNGLLDNILSDFLTEKIAAQTRIEEVLAIVNACNADQTVVDSEKQDLFTLNRDNLWEHKHTTERSAYEAEQLECSKVLDIVNGWQVLWAGSCDVIDNHESAVRAAVDTRNESTEWTLMNTISVWLTQETTFTQEKKEEFSSQKSLCESAVQAHASAESKSETDQSTTEQAYCAWKLVRDGMCQTRDTCYAGAMANHQAILVDEKTRADLRCNEARLINYVICVVQRLIDSTDDNPVNASACLAQWGADQMGREEIQRYNITEPVVPDKDACDTAAVSVDVGSAGWNTFLGRHSDGTALDCTGLECPFHYPAFPEGCPTNGGGD